MGATTRLVPVLEIGGTHVAGALVDLDTTAPVAPGIHREPLAADGDVAAITTPILRCGDALGAPSGAPWGVAIPGPFDYERGIGQFRDVGKFESLRGFDVGALLRERLAARPRSVLFRNDAQSFGYGEWRFGAAAGHARCVCVTLGTGVGSAFLADGVAIDDAPDVPPEGRADLLRIGDAPLEEVVSRRAILAAYRRSGATDADNVDVSDIAARCRAGEPRAAHVLRGAFGALGAALAPWLARFRATALVVGGAMTGSWDLLEPTLRAGMAGVRPRLLDTVSVVPAAHPDTAALLGIAAWTVECDQPARDAHP